MPEETEVQETQWYLEARWGSSHPMQMRLATPDEVEDGDSVDTEQALYCVNNQISEDHGTLKKIKHLQDVLESAGAQGLVEAAHRWKANGRS
jgi:hypothetical protein